MSPPNDAIAYRTAAGVSNEVALLYGPVVLAGEMGTNAMPSPSVKRQTELSRLPAPAAPVFVCEAEKLLAHVQPVSGKALTFRTQGLGRPSDVTLIPFYRMHRERYSVYWKQLSELQWQAHQVELAAAEARRIADEACVLDSVSPGESQPETDHHFQGGDTHSGDFKSRKWRDASDWFSYEVKILSDQPMMLACTFWGSDGGRREFDVLVDGKIIATQKLNNERPGEFFEATYPVPVELTKGNNTAVVKFVAHAGNKAGGVFGVRILKAQTNSKQ